MAHGETGVWSGHTGRKRGHRRRVPIPSGGWGELPHQVRSGPRRPGTGTHQPPTRTSRPSRIKAPPEFAKAAIRQNYLPAEDSFETYPVSAATEMMALGFPRGLSANSAGFPILRSGRVASYPLSPAKVFPTFLLDFSVFPGNSGGPVFVSRALKTGPLVQASDGGEAAPGFIAGLLTQQVELNNERLEIGIVTHARYIRETIALMQNPGLAPSTFAEGMTAVSGSRTASAEEAARD